MQAIVTKFHGPTNAKGSRYSAQCAGLVVYVSSDHALSPDGNREAAREKLLKKLKERAGRDLIFANGEGE